MKVNIKPIAPTFVVVILFHFAVRAGVIDEFSRSVVFLNHKYPVTETVDGTNYEVWLKSVADPNAMPHQKVAISSGSGLIVIIDVRII